MVPESNMVRPDFLCQTLTPMVIYQFQDSTQRKISTVFTKPILVHMTSSFDVIGRVTKVLAHHDKLLTQ